MPLAHPFRPAFARPLAALGIAALAATAGAAQRYHVTDLGEHIGYAINASGDVAGGGYGGPFLYSEGRFTALGSLGGPNGLAFGLDAARNVVGMSETAKGYGHAFEFSGAGPMTDLGAAAGDEVSSEAHGVNDRGVVVGWTTAIAGGLPQAFIARDGNLRSNSPAGALGSGLQAVNRAGQAVGFAHYAFANGNNYAAHAVLYANGKWKRLGQLSPSSRATSYAEAINEAGQVAGSSNVAEPFGRSHAFLWTRGVMKDLGTLGDPATDTSLGLGLNNLGHVVGESLVAGAPRAFLHDGSAMVDLNMLLDAESQGFTLEIAWGINDAGQIVVQGTPAGGGAAHGLLLTPVGLD